VKLMHVDTSPKSTSNSRMLGQYFVEQLNRNTRTLSVDYLDLSVDALPHVTEAFAAATYTPTRQRTKGMAATLEQSDRLCARLLDADALLFAMPMHNWTMPSTFKTFVDAIVRTDLTYTVTDDGRYIGKLFGKKVLFLTTRGADLRPGSPFNGMDALTPALRAAFSFIGVTDMTFVDAQPMQFASADARAQALIRARGELAAVADTWTGIRDAAAA
jgi:FMN-dependent NADH-azoreductase